MKPDLNLYPPDVSESALAYSLAFKPFFLYVKKIYRTNYDLKISIYLVLLLLFII